MTPPQSNSPSEDVRGYFEQPEAWTQVSQGLQRIALAIVGNERDAEDVVQGAWLEALRDPERQPSEGWMRRLVRFRALDALRRKRKEPVGLPSDFPESQAGDGIDTKWKLEAQREVLDAVQALKEPYLSTIVLRYFEGKGPREIALQLGVPERTIKTRLTRAHTHLRERLGARYQDQFGNWAPALLAFSGFKGPKLGALSIPTAGALIMKKKLLVVAALAVAVCIPFALQTRGATPDEEIQPESTGADLVGLHTPAQVKSPSVQERELVVHPADGVAQDQNTVELAFPSLSEAESGSIGIRVRWSDGSPAENLKIGVMAEHAPDAFLMGRTAYTDATGYVLVERVTPGPAKVFFHRLGNEEIEVLAGEYVQVEKEAQLGTRFSGQVLSPSGQPVAGAEIYVADSRGGDSLPRPTAVADGAGRYEIKSVYDRSYFSARSPGFAPSLPIETGISTGDAMELDLTLREKPGTVRGIALSPTGLPVTGAKVHIDLAGVDMGPGVRREAPLAFTLETDGEGRFETDCIGAGEIMITARTQVWQPWVERLSIAEDAPLDVEIRFERGVELTGVVREENGDPVPDAHLYVGPNADLASYRVLTDSNGMYTIHGLPAGTSDMKVYQKQFEELRTTMTLRSDTANQVDFTLHRLQDVSGVVVDQRGAPIERWYVAVETGRGQWSAGSWTDSEGAFHIVGIPDESTDLMVTNEDYWESGVRIPVPSVLPTKDSIRITVPDSALPSSSIRAKIRVDGAPAPVETRIRLRSSSPLTHRDVHPDSNGSLLMERLAGRQYHLEVSLEGHAAYHRT
ncbi:MAG: sigma-70 family RNA polymerase sigma factor, partial [Planctomycetota bacterium]|nr:sigma-70 family RNA polymerase sigma factor [Planctomycetota bacterium]